jgi:hypothetical protein
MMMVGYLYNLLFNGEKIIFIIIVGRANRINPRVRCLVTRKLDIHILQARKPGKSQITIVTIEIDHATKGKYVLHTMINGIKISISC